MAPNVGHESMTLRLSLMSKTKWLCEHTQKNLLVKPNIPLMMKIKTNYEIHQPDKRHQ